MNMTYKMFQNRVIEIETTISTTKNSKEICIPKGLGIYL